MSGACKRERKRYDVSKRSVKISGKKWERPIPKSKEYWEKFCDDEEKKLIIVRNPFPLLSHNYFSRNVSELVNFKSCVNDEISDRNSSSNYSTDDRKASDNSLHESFPAKSRSKLNKDRCNGSKSFLKPISKALFRPASTIPDTTCNLATPSKVARIPKLDTLGPQPSSGKILPAKVDRTRAPFNVQNEPNVQTESSSTLPILGAYPSTIDPQLTLNKLRKHLRLPEKKDIKTKDRPRYKIAAVKNKKSSENQSTIDQIKKESKKAPTDEYSLKYSARFAYKALKHLTKNKNLDFKVKSTDHFQQKPFFESSTNLLSSDEEEELLNVKDTEECERNEESLRVRDIKKISKAKSLNNLEFLSDIECPSLKSDETISRTIPTESRSTSGNSPEFVYPDDSKSPFTHILSSIPKLSGYPRKNLDRCLPCMFKPFEAPSERKISLPRTALQRLINPESTVIVSLKNSFEDSESISASIASFENEVKRIFSSDVETKNVTCDEKSNASESRIVTRAIVSFQEKCEQLAETVRQRSIPESESSHKAMTKNAKGDEQNDYINLNDPTVSSVQITPLERTKVPSSFHSESSEEDNSIVVSINDDQPKPKYLVPCHAPTIFKPSLEPLRALRNRKPTTLQDRIAFLESTSLKKSTSIDDYDDIPEKPRSVHKSVVEKDKTAKEEKPAPPPLTKAKSVLEKLTFESVKGNTEKQRHVLRKGSSLSSFSISTDINLNRSEIYGDGSNDDLQKLTASYGDVFSESPLATDFSRGRARLPLIDSNEIAVILENLKETSSSTNMLEVLCKEFSERLSNDTKNDDSNPKDRNRMIATLTRLLVDSKRYLYPNKFPSDLLFSTNQPPPCNSRLLRRIFPLKTYNLVAPLLGMPECYPKKEAAFQIKDSDYEIRQTQTVDEKSSTSDSLEVQPPTPRGTESPSDEEKVGHRRYNPYALFLIKPRRKVVTWRPLTKRDLEGYDPDATLEMRADNSMKRICQDFCQWVETLGGTDNAIDETVLRDMFEIDFSAEACRAMQVSIQELPVVPAEVALTRNCPEASKLNMTKKHVTRDVKAEERPMKIKAFNTSVPWKLRFVPPNNQVRKKWLQCENVPQDIETMEVVWKDITHLRSVRGFVEWLQQHPEVPQPHALKKITSMDVRSLRQTEDDETFAHLELDINQIKSLRIALNDNDATL